MDALLSIDNLTNVLGILAGIGIGGPISSWIYDQWRDSRSKIGKFPDMRGTWCITVYSGDAPAYMEQLSVNHQRNDVFRGDLVSPTGNPRNPRVVQVVHGKFHQTDTASFTSQIEQDEQLEVTVGLVLLGKDRTHGEGQSIYYGVTTDSKGLKEPQVARLTFQKNGNLNGTGRFRNCDHNDCKTCAVYAGNTKGEN